MQRHDIDIRVFRRYPREIYFTLGLQGRTVPARTVDYSLNSLGIVIESQAMLRPGDTLDLDIDELDIHQKGRVVWVRESGKGARAGIIRLGALEGNLRDYQLPDVLLGFQRTLKTGVLSLSQGAAKKELYIRDGNIIYSTSTEAGDRIGDILLREGRLSREQYEQAAELQRRTGRRYVMILVDSGFLRPSDLLGVVELQATRIIEGLFLMPHAEFRFVEGSLPCETPVSLRLSVADLIYREVKKTADLELLRKGLPGVIPDFSQTPLNLFQNIRLEDADKRLLSYVDGRRSVARIMELSGMDPSAALAGFHALLETRLLEVKKRGGTPHGLMPPEGSAAGDASYCDLIQKIDGMHEKYRHLDYYRLLDTDRRSSPEEIKKAYFKAAREFHPDMHIDLPFDIKEKLVDIFSRINSAYLTLKDHEKRTAYDSSLGKDAGAAGTIPAEEAPEYAVIRSEPAQGKEAGEECSPVFSQSAGIARTKFEEGRASFRKGRFEEAASLFASAIYFDSSRPEYHYFYGYALEKLGKLREALQSLNRANIMAPSNADIVAAIGHVYLRLGCPLRAKGSFERALKAGPDNKRAIEGMDMARELLKPGRASF